MKVFAVFHPDHPRFSKDRSPEPPTPALHFLRHGKSSAGFGPYPKTKPQNGEDQKATQTGNK